MDSSDKLYSQGKENEASVDASLTIWFAVPARYEECPNTRLASAMGTNGAKHTYSTRCLLLLLLLLLLLT